MKFAKPPLTISEKLDLLRRRGMTIADNANAEHYLRHVSYYRLRAYWLPFEVNPPPDDDHMFRPEASISDAITLYDFDRQLRLLLVDALERIEVSLRGSWAYCLAIKYGAHAYSDAGLYRDQTQFAKDFEHVLRDIKGSKETFINHYRSKYDEPKHPPIWMVSEIISFSRLSKLYGNLKFRTDRQAIAKQYGLDEVTLVSLIHHLAYIRNICAHHGRLWNKQFTITMKIPHYPVSLKMAMSTVRTNRLYNTLVVVAYLVELISPGSAWRRKIVTLLEGCPLARPELMGFPQNWKTIPAWQQP